MSVAPTVPDPRWLTAGSSAVAGTLPATEIGAIRIGQAETYFQIPRTIAEEIRRSRRAAGRIRWRRRSADDRTFGGWPARKPPRSTANATHHAALQITPGSRRPSRQAGTSARKPRPLAAAGPEARQACCQSTNTSAGNPKNSVRVTRQQSGQRMPLPCPPSTPSAAPVTQPARAETSQTAASAISSGLPRRPKRMLPCAPFHRPAGFGSASHPSRLAGNSTEAG